MWTQIEGGKVSVVVLVYMHEMASDQISLAGDAMNNKMVGHISDLVFSSCTFS